MRLGATAGAYRAGGLVSHFIRRAHYADMFGPTAGDRVCLGDTGLIAEVERDHTTYGDECSSVAAWLRDRQGQMAGSTTTARSTARDHQRARRRLDGRLQGRHRHQEPAHRRHRQGGQLDVMWRRHARECWWGVTTEAIAGEVVTAGGIDSQSSIGLTAAGFTRRWPPASPPSSAAAPARRRAPAPPPARRARGTSG